MIEQQELRGIADELRSCDELRRCAEAGVITKMCELAEAYRVEAEDLLDVLEEKRIRLGGAGTPTVSEFICLELAGLLRCSATVAAGRLADALDLKHRHPGLFVAVRDLRVDPDRALHAAHLCRDLSPELASVVAGRWLSQQDGLGWTAAFNLLKKLILEADPVEAERKERETAEFRGVWTWGLHEGAMNLTGRLDVLDARYLDESLSRMADVIAPQSPELNKNQLRAKALGVLAHPAHALALIQEAVQPALTDPDFASSGAGGDAIGAGADRAAIGAGVPLTDPSLALLPGDEAGLAGNSWAGIEPGEVPEAVGSEGMSLGASRAALAGKERFPVGYVGFSRQGYDPHVCGGHVCGTITAPLAKLRPCAEVVIHLHADSMGKVSGVARVEKAGHITTALVSEILQGVDVTVQPVIDLPELEPVDSYVPPPKMRRALMLMMNTEMFPFSNTRSRNLDLDHTVAYRLSGGKGQTRIGNLAPLGRRAHRAKTAGIWRVQQPLPGVLAWESPLKYRYQINRYGLTQILE